MKEGGWAVITIVTDFVDLGNRHPPYLPPAAILQWTSPIF